MNMTDYVLDNLNPMEILIHYGFRNLTENDDIIRACCEIHKGNNPTTFVWNKSNNLWFCHTGDCYGGDVFSLVEKMEHIDFPSAVRRTAEILNLNVDGMEILELQSKLLSEQRKWLSLQKKKLTVASNKNMEYKLPYTKYYSTCSMFSRFADDTIRHFNGLFCKLFPTDNSILYNKLVIPIEDNHRCVGVALRDTTGHHLLSCS